MGEINFHSPEDNFQVIAEGEIVSECGNERRIVVKGAYVTIRLPSTALQYLEYVGEISDPSKCNECPYT